MLPTNVYFCSNWGESYRLRVAPMRRFVSSIKELTKIFARLIITNNVFKYVFLSHNIFLCSPKIRCMASRIQKITLLPALIMFVLSILFAVGSLFVVVFSVKQVLLILVLSLFIGGLTYSIYWGYSWIWAKKLHERNSGFILNLLSKNREIGLFLLSLGLVIVFWVFQLVWKDIVVWNKDLGLIFFWLQSRWSVKLGFRCERGALFFLRIDISASWLGYGAS